MEALLDPLEKMREIGMTVGMFKVVERKMLTWHKSIFPY